LYNTHRTVRIHIGIGSGESKTFEGVEYSKNDLFIYNDVNYTYTAAHP
jgi:hypothetical protein